MNSKRIGAAIDQLVQHAIPVDDDGKFDPIEELFVQRSQAEALFEIAFQLALMNEGDGIDTDGN